jgi:hypothetical protein
VSGDVYNLKCDGTVKQENGVTQGLTASHSAFVLGSAGVARTDPLKATLSDNVADNDQVTGNDIIEGDHIRIENQVRTVVKVSGKVVHVDKPFEEIATSDHTYIFPQYTPVEVIHDMGGVRSSCTVTDLRQLTSTKEVCAYAPGTDRDVRACGHFTANKDAINNRTEQIMREINPAYDIPTYNIDIDVSKDAGPTITASSGDIAGMATNALIDVKVGMSVSFKIQQDNTAGSFASMGVVTAVDNSAKTFSVSNAAAVTADYETNKWDATTCSGDCCTGTQCQMRFTQAAVKAELMDEREVEIGDRIRILTSLGSWETRTVDSVTYTSGYQVTGFVVSEPYENTVSDSEDVSSSTINSNGNIDQNTAKCAVGDFCKIAGEDSAASDGVYQVATTGSGTTTFSATFGKPSARGSQTITFTKTHLAYNDGAGTTEAKSCSGRGLCDDSSGECQCFKGYTGVDCSIQNALAV